MAAETETGDVALKSNKSATWHLVLRDVRSDEKDKREKKKATEEKVQTASDEELRVALLPTCIVFSNNRKGGGR